MRKRLCILGSTGSVGLSTLKVVAAFRERFDVVLLAANRSRQVLLEQARRFKPRAVSLGSREDAAWLRQRLNGSDTRVVAGSTDLIKLIQDTRIDLTISAIVGAAGLAPTMAAIRTGSHIGLANKESMVIAGAFVNQLARAADIAILPIDSEHNALHQCLRGEKREEVRRLILTASGGPFRTYSGSFDEITPQQALAHPTWDMGAKITIDSATMMNKGLEVIEAHHLFGFSGENIGIVVHPQSIVHSMIETVDGSYICQMGKTDMVGPIQYVLTYPDRYPNPFGALDITKGLRLEFFEVDKERFPCIQLAYDALRAGGAAPAVLNAANEIAVAAFLQGRIRFSDIARVNRHCLDGQGQADVSSLDEILTVDHKTRGFAEAMIANLGVVS